jgi:hypothetical protein
VSPMAEAPAFRRLRVFAFDPSLALQLQTAPIQEITIRVPWERDPDWERLTPGPIGEYLEVIDVDPASGVVYPPVDLDDPTLLAQDGVRPSEGNPQFHQQMVYAVAMATIGHFERALGRVALWAPRRVAPARSPTGRWQVQFVRRLRIYPHALRDQNAYYSPDKKALLFGYFPVRTKDAYNTPGTTVFTCLSHDIVAHEVTHALLDGVHPRFNEPSNPDVRSFHEAFADIVALFQHFAYPGVLRDQIARTRGDLQSESLLGQLAQQFGRATGRGSALRDALGEPDGGVWKRRQPDPRALDTAMEPHRRGAILVAAVFGAFLRLYRLRSADLFRIASQGTGTLPDGDIHPDLANRLADEAARTAQDVLQMCIRALDFCPPLNITFGDYLRAIVTADLNAKADDESARIAVVESFREWGIYPRGIRGMSIEALTWPSGAEVIADAQSDGAQAGRTAPAPDAVADALRTSHADLMRLFDDLQPGRGAADGEPPAAGVPLRLSKWDLDSDRFEVWKTMQRNCRAVWYWLVQGEGQKYAPALGIVLADADPWRPRQTIYRDDWGAPSVEVHSVRTALRRDARGAVMTDLVIEVTQRRRGFFDPAEQKRGDAQAHPFAADEDGDFKFRAGCTIVVDTTRCVFRHIIRTAGTVADDGELDRVRQFLTAETGAAADAFEGMRMRSLRDPRPDEPDEPFALLHRSLES